MPFERLPESVQTLYAELFEQTIHAAAEAAAEDVTRGSFVTKTIKGGTYWYLQRREGNRKRQRYLGRESPALLAWMEESRQVRESSAADEAQRARLGRMLETGGAARESAAVAKILALLARAGVFRRGGVLVGTQAFRAYGNLLGVRFEQRALRTQDVDIAQDRAIGIALAEGEEPGEVASSLAESGLGFFPVPALDPRQQSTSFKVRGRELRIDFLTPLVGPQPGAPVFLPGLGISAHPLPFLDYLIADPTQAVVLGGSGILVNLPDPARFALHKLWTSAQRPVAEQTKAAKDLRQAGDLLEVLLEDRPQDLLAAGEALRHRPAALKAVVAVAGRLSSELRAKVEPLLRVGLPSQPSNSPA